MPTPIITPANLAALTRSVRADRAVAAPSSSLADRILRGTAARALRGIGRRPTRTTIEAGSVQRVLLIVPYAIGDYLVATPLLEWLHQAVPQAAVDVVTSPVLHGLAAADPRIARVEVVQVDGNMPAMLRTMAAFVEGRTYEVVYAPAIHYVTRAMRLARVASGSPIIVGSEQERRNDIYRHFFDHLIPHYYPLGHWCDAYASAGPLAIEHQRTISVGPSLPGLSSNAIQHADVAVNISAKEAKRSIGIDHAIEIIRNIRSSDVTRRIVVLAAPNDQDRSEAVVSGVADPECRLFRGDLQEIASLVKGARVVITPDTSIVHIASAVRTPVVGLYLEPHKVVEWGPYNVPFRALVSDDPESLSPLPARSIADAAEELLNETEVPS